MDADQPSPETRARAMRLFLDVYKLSHGERSDRIETECGDDVELRTALEDLLAHHDEPRSQLQAVEDLVEGETRRLSEPVARPETGFAATTEIPDVRIEGMIGRGGQGVVWRGEQTYLGRPVAVKVMPPEEGSTSFAARFRREAKILAGMTHPNIVTCYQAGTTNDGSCYLVMELVDGPDLGAHVDENGPLAVDDALRVGHDLALALQYAERSGIVHRDVKPANVLLKPHAGAATPSLPYDAKLADLGLARDMDSEASWQEVTTQGEIIGTLVTMAPEQIEDPAAVDFRADIYGLGCVLFYALTGRHAFTGMRDKLRGVPLDVTVINRDAPRNVADLLLKMLATERGRRHASYDALLADIDRVRNELRKRREHRSRIVPILAATVALLVILIAVVTNLGGPGDGGSTAATKGASPDLVAVVPAQTVAEGTRVRLEGELRGEWPDAVSPSWRWRQTKGPALALPTTTLPTLSFDAPRGFEKVPLMFELEVVAGAIQRTQRFTVIVEGDVANQPLAKGVSVDLCGEMDRPAPGWSGAAGEAWNRANDHRGLLCRCVERGSHRYRFLPRGHWTVRGGIEPLPLRLRSQPRKLLERAALRFEFACGNAAVLEMKSLPSGRFLARFVHVEADGASWREVATLARREGAWGRSKPLRFAVTWTEEKLSVAFGSKPTATDWRGYDVDIREWKTQFPPSKLSLDVGIGQVCFCDFEIVGE